VDPNPNPKKMSSDPQHCPEVMDLIMILVVRNNPVYDFWVDLLAGFVEHIVPVPFSVPVTKTSQLKVNYKTYLGPNLYSDPDSQH
jgi:hypothetical protein